MADILAKVKAILNGKINTEEIDKEIFENSRVYVIFYDIDKFTLRYTEEEFIAFRREHVLERYERYNADNVGDLLFNYIHKDALDIYKDLMEHCIEYVLGSETVRVITNDITELDKALDSFEYSEEVIELINKLKLKLSKDSINKGEVLYDI